MHRHVRALCVALGCLAFAREDAVADVRFPPWHDVDDAPLPASVRSVRPKRADTPVVREPGATSLRRGTVGQAARLPVYAVKRGLHCITQWLEVAQGAWLCGDQVEASGELPWANGSPGVERADALPHPYAFVARGGARAYAHLEDVEDEAYVEELQPGFGVAVRREHNAAGERWVETTKGFFVRARELAPARASSFSGMEFADKSAIAKRAWVKSARTSVYGADGKKKIGRALARREVLTLRDVRKVRSLELARFDSAPDDAADQE